MKIQLNTIGPVLIFAIILIFGLVVLGYHLSPEPVDNTPRIGDIWEHYATGDPFIKEEVYKREIIDIKYGYIRFVENDRDTLSRTINSFKYNSERIKIKKIKSDTIKKGR